MKALLILLLAIIFSLNSFIFYKSFNTYQQVNNQINMENDLVYKLNAWDIVVTQTTVKILGNDFKKSAEISEQQYNLLCPVVRVSISNKLVTFIACE